MRRLLLVFALASCAFAQSVGSGITQPISASQLPASVPTSVVNDTNVTGAISANALTLGWTGALAKARQHAATAYTDQANTFTGSPQRFAAPTNAVSLYLVPIVNGSYGQIANVSTAPSRNTTFYVSNQDVGNLSFMTSSTANSSVVRASITSAGNVGIATTAPTQALTVNGSISTIALATPGTPTVTPTGAAGSTAYSYVIVAKQNDGSYTAGGAAGSTATGNATLDGTNYNAITWSAVTNAASYDVYRTVGGASQGKIATSVTTTAYNDQGAAGNSASAPTTATTGTLTAATAKIFDPTASTGSTTLTVQAGAGQSTNNLQQWNTSGGVTTANVTGSGVFQVPALTLYNSTGTGTAAQTQSISHNPAYSGSGQTVTSRIDLVRPSTTNGNYDGYLAFFTRANGSSIAEAVRITQAQNVLIATTTDNTNSGAKLQVAGNGVQLVGAAQPTCDANHAGLINYSGHTTNVKDTVAVCAADGSNVWAFRAIY